MELIPNNKGGMKPCFEGHKKVTSKNTICRLNLDGSSTQNCSIICRSWCECRSLKIFSVRIGLGKLQALRPFEREMREMFLFNDVLNTFYLWLYGVRHMVKDHYDSEKGNPLPPHRLLLSINSKCSFICTIPQTR